jgi:23S rRNA (uracil1939-C5)-methyltransferase
LEIEAVGAQGDGIAREGGRTVYVPLAAPGDRVLARLGDRRGDGIAASLLELLRPGAGRAEPPCRHFGTCGGCLVQHLEAGAYRAWKRGIVVEALAHRGLGEVEVAPLAVLEPAGRRRAVFAARRGRGQVFLGFNEHRSRRIVDLADCKVVAAEILAILPPLRHVLGRVLAEGGAADVAVTLLDDGLDVVVHLPAEPGLAALEALAAFAAEADLARLSFAPAGRRGPPTPIAHRRAGVTAFAGVPVVVPPGAFLQASRAGERLLVQLVTGAAAGAGRVADLHCGVGTFTFPLAAAGAAVLAADREAEAVAAVAAAAKAVGLAARVEAQRRDLGRDPLAGRELEGLGAVVLDPPRSGAAAQAAALAASAVPTVIAVSCNPATFARDARTLVDGGYRPGTVVPIDQFPWSTHLELVAVFTR